MATNNAYIKLSLGWGNLIAVLISWKLYSSVGWAILHGLLGFIYVIYWAIFIGHL